VFSISQDASEVYWSGAPANAYSEAWQTNSIGGYAMLAYQISGGVKYFNWGFFGSPDTFTSAGTNLFKNVVDWLLK